MNRSIAAIAGATVLLALVPIVFLSLATPDETEASANLDPRFVGNWDLVSFVSFRESGEVVDNDYIGRIMYDAAGNMSAVGMPRDLAERPRNPDGSQVRSGFAYFSTVEVHPDQGFIVHKVIGSPMNPSWGGSRQVRFFEFEDDLLRLSLREGNVPTGRVTGTLTWRRIR